MTETETLFARMVYRGTLLQADLPKGSNVVPFWVRYRGLSYTTPQKVLQRSLWVGFRVPLLSKLKGLVLVTMSQCSRPDLKKEPYSYNLLE